MGVSNGKNCSVPNCQNNKGRCPYLTFFRFPKDPERSKVWLQNIGNQDLHSKSVKYLNNNCVVCPIHFESKMFMDPKRTKLVPKAVPTIFNFPTKKSPEKKKSAKKQLSKDTPSKPDLPDSGPSKSGEHQKQQMEVANFRGSTDHEYCATDNDGPSSPKPADSMPQIFLSAHSLSDDPKLEALVQTRNPSASSVQVFKLTIKSAPGTKALKGVGASPSPVVCNKAVEAALKIIQARNKSAQDAADGNQPAEKDDSGSNIVIQDVISNYKGHNQGVQKLKNVPGPSPKLQSILVKKVSLPANGAKSKQPPTNMPLKQISQQVINKLSNSIKENVKKPAFECTCTCCCPKCRSADHLRAKLNEAKRKLATSRAQVSRLNKKVQRTIDKASERPKMRDIQKELRPYLNKEAYEFTLAQMRAAGNKANYYCGNRWSSDMKNLILTVYRDSPRAYKMMMKVFKLPSKHSLVIYENQLKELHHLENEMAFGTGSLDQNAEAEEDKNEQSHGEDGDCEETENQPAKKKLKLLKDEYVEGALYVQEPDYESSDSGDDREYSIKMMSPSPRPKARLNPTLGRKVQESSSVQAQDRALVLSHCGSRLEPVVILEECVVEETFRGLPRDAESPVRKMTRKIKFPATLRDVYSCESDEYSTLRPPDS